MADFTKTSRNGMRRGTDVSNEMVPKVGKIVGRIVEMAAADGIRTAAADHCTNRRAIRPENTMTRLVMAAWVIGVLAAGFPGQVSGQQPQPGMPPASPPSGTMAAVPDDTVQKAGAALRQVVQIRKDYAQRIQAAKTQDQQQQLAQQATADALQAVQAQGLSPDEYNRVIRQARADPGLRKRLLTAAGQPSQ